MSSSTSPSTVARKWTVSGLSRRHAVDDAQIQINNLLTIYGAGDAGDTAPFSGDGFFFFRFFFFS